MERSLLNEPSKGLEQHKRNFRRLRRASDDTTKLLVAKSLAFSKVEYFLHLQPLDEECINLFERLVNAAARWVMGISGEKLRRRARVALGLEKLEARRWRSAVSLKSQLQWAIKSSEPGPDK